MSSATDASVVPGFNSAKMLEDRVYMHQNCIDCAIIIGPSRTFNWLNLGYTGAPWICDRNSYTLSPEIEQAPEWIDITAQIYKPRTQPGVPR